MADASFDVAERVRRGALVPDAPSVSIIILVTTDTDRLQRCLASMPAGLHDGPPAEIVVLANGTAATALAPLAGREDIVLVRSAVNLGFGGGCNWAARFARGAHLVFINDDAVVTAGWLAALESAMNDDAGTGVVGGRVLLGSGRLQEAGNVVWRDGSTSHIGRGLRADEPRLLRRRDVDYVSFCSAMVRRETWEDVGGFDERYFPAYYEDADLCFSARAQGWRVVCEPSAVVIHDEGASTPAELRHFLSARHQRLFAAKWRPRLAGQPVRPRRVTPGAVMKAAFTTRDDQRRDVANARHRLGGARSSPGANAPDDRPGPAADEATIRALEARHLAAHAAMEAEYADHLATRQADAGGNTSLRRRYVVVRHALGSQLRRHPRIARAVERLRSRIGAAQ